LRLLFLHIVLLVLIGSHLATLADLHVGVVFFDELDFLWLKCGDLRIHVTIAVSIPIRIYSCVLGIAVLLLFLVLRFGFFVGLGGRVIRVTVKVALFGEKI